MLKNARAVANSPDMPESSEESKICNSPIVQMISFEEVKTLSTSATENSSAKSHPAMLDSLEFGSGSPEGKAIPRFDIFSPIPEEESKVAPLSGFIKSRFEDFEESKVVRTEVQNLGTLIAAKPEVVKEGVEEEIEEEIEE